MQTVIYVTLLIAIVRVVQNLAIGKDVSSDCLGSPEMIDAPVEEHNVNETFFKRNQPEMYHGVTYRSAALFCLLHNFTYPHEIRWYKKVNGTFRLFKTGYALEHGQQLQLFTLVKPDSGTYQCRLKSKGHVIAKRQMLLDVQDDSIFIRKQKFQYSVISGSNVTLHCAVKDKLPISKISWRRLANRASDFASEQDEVLFGDQQLQVYISSKSNEGQYVCDVYVGHQQVASRWMNLTVFEHDAFDVNQPHVVRVSSGQSVTLTCQLKLNVQGQLRKWMWKPHMAMHSELPTPMGTNLVLPSVTKENEGQYWCFVDTDEGQAVRLIYLHVSVHPVFKEGQPSVYHALNNVPVEMTCIVKSRVDVTQVTWFLKQVTGEWEQIVSGPYIMGKKLVLDVPPEYAKGEYKCIVETADEVATRWMRVFVNAPQIPVLHRTTIPYSDTRRSVNR